MAAASEIGESSMTTASFYDLVKRDAAVPSQGDSNDPELLKQLTKQGKGLKVVDDEQQKMSDILNAMLPPREFEQGGTTWIQRTGTDVPSREDVKALRNQIDVALAERQARESGICPVREDIYSQSFDELIRQVAIECPERGLLLQRVRDELRMTISAYQTLYLRSISFGQSKSTDAESALLAPKHKVDLLVEETSALRSTVKDLADRCELVEAAEQAKTSDAREVHAAEIGRIEEQIRQLQEFCQANDVPILEEEEQGEGDEETGEDKAEDDGAGGADAEKEA